MQPAVSLALHDGSRLESFHSGHSLEGDTMDCDEGRLSPSIGANSIPAPESSQILTAPHLW